VSYPASIQRCHEIIAKLEDKIEELKAQVDYTQDKPHRYPVDPNRVKYGLGEREAFLFSMLRYDCVTSTSYLREQFGYGSEKNIVTVLCHLRKKLAKHGIKIKNVHGLGYLIQKG